MPDINIVLVENGASTIKRDGLYDGSGGRVPIMMDMTGDCVVPGVSSDIQLTDSGVCSFADRTSVQLSLSHGKLARQEFPVDPQAKESTTPSPTSVCFYVSPTPSTTVACSPLVSNLQFGATKSIITFDVTGLARAAANTDNLRYRLEFTGGAGQIDTGTGQLVMAPIPFDPKVQNPPSVVDPILLALAILAGLAVAVILGVYLAKRSSADG